MVFLTKFKTGDTVEALYGKIEGKELKNYTANNYKKMRGVGTIIRAILRNKNTDTQLYKVLVNGNEYTLTEKQLRPLRNLRGGSRRKRTQKRRRTHRR
jgi:hypothetical protein